MITHPYTSNSVFSALCDLIEQRRKTDHVKKYNTKAIHAFCAKYLRMTRPLNSSLSMDLDLSTSSVLVFDIVRRDNGRFSKHSAAVGKDIFLRSFSIEVHGGGAPIKGSKGKYHRALLKLLVERLSRQVE